VPETLRRMRDLVAAAADNRAEVETLIGQHALDDLKARSRFLAAVHSAVAPGATEFQLTSSAPIQSLDAPLGHWLSDNLVDPLREQLDDLLDSALQAMEPVIAFSKSGTGGTEPGALWGTWITRCRGEGKFTPGTLLISEGAWKSAYLEYCIVPENGMVMRPDAAEERLRSVLRQRFNVVVALHNDPSPMGLLLPSRPSVGTCFNLSIHAELVDSTVLCQLAGRYRLAAAIPFATVAL